ncbi:MAG: metallophosphoesterase [Evtepia sp.]|uniref:metallophosphoesterase n=1 Tax=Evtepia sp. TaxID=2773933 RepID=UPI002A7564E2|nr:metallophosphoesterase [Evtepia sp.]MDY3014354.1 metallophosphoesterase [Evtepia sp.]
MLLLLSLLALLLAGWLLWANKALVLTPCSLSSPRLPEAFDGYRIAHLSDLHNRTFGPENRRLLELLEQANPDLIVLTGDLFDSYRLNPAVALDFVRRAQAIAPCFFVPGNHEARIASYPSLRQDLQAAGVQALENRSVSLRRAGSHLSLVGLADPGFHKRTTFPNSKAYLAAHLPHCSTQDPYTILLSHRPEYMPFYVQSGVDLVLSGHAHGGQIRLPFVGGIFSPGQGFFPRYTSGCCQEGQTSMVISRGLGNSSFPLRVLNRPEVVLLELHHTSVPSLP